MSTTTSLHFVISALEIKYTLDCAIEFFIDLFSYNPIVTSIMTSLIFNLLGEDENRFLRMKLIEHSSPCSEINHLLLMVGP